MLRRRTRGGWRERLGACHAPSARKLQAPLTISRLIAVTKMAPKRGVIQDDGVQQRRKAAGEGSLARARQAHDEKPAVDARPCRCLQPEPLYLAREWQ